MIDTSSRPLHKASKMILKNDRVSVVFFGDGASNRGTFHEAMNVASAWKLPVIFVNEMNCWASTTPYRTTCNVENISDRAAGYHVPGVVVDGQDVFAVYEAAKELVDGIRAGGGPAVLDCTTYRWRGHFEGDQTKYRDPAVTEEWKKNKDCVAQMEQRLQDQGVMTAEEIQQMRDEINAKIEDAVAYAESSPEPTPEDLFRNLYAE